MCNTSVFFLALALPAALAYCNDESVGGLKLNLIIHSKELLPFEPCWVTIRLTNAGNQNTTVGNADWIRARQYKLGTNDDPVIVIRDVRPTSVAFWDKVVLQPGSSMSHTETLMMKREGDGSLRPLFAKPGVYRLVVNLPKSDLQGEGSFEVLTCPSHAVPAMKLFGNPAVSKGLVGIGPFISEAMVKVMQESGNSVYGDHARFYLGKYFQKRASDPYLAEIRPDYVWAQPAVKSWCRSRAFHHFSLVSTKIPILRFHAKLHQSQVTVGHFDIWALHDEIIERFKAAPDQVNDENSPRRAIQLLRRFALKYVEDSRLDGTIRLNGTKTFGDAIGYISTARDVPLTVPDVVGKRKYVPNSFLPLDIRDFLTTLGYVHGVWVVDGRGYRLVLKKGVKKKGERERERESGTGLLND